MKSPDLLIEEFERAAASLRASENACRILPGIMVIRGLPLNSFRNSIVHASLSFDEEGKCRRCLERVQRFKLSETSTFNGTAVKQEWDYQRNGEAETFVFKREFPDRDIRETAVLRRKSPQDVGTFEFNRDAVHNFF